MTTTPTSAIINVSSNVSLFNTEFIDVLVYYSPVILSFCVLIISVFYQTYKGVFLFGFVAIFGLLRLIFINSLTSLFNPTTSSINKNCSSFSSLQKYKTDGFIVFFVTFVTGYILAPIFIYKKYNNISVILFLGIYMLGVIIKNVTDGCSDLSTTLTNMIYGVGSVAASIFFLMSVGMSNMLFNEDLFSDATVCSMPSNQTFKCSVYKNGEVISSSTMKSNS
jgi:hypothetical protein